MIRVLIGHVLARLLELPAESVHCVVTSPPYYGLRDYGIEPQVWGGEVGCAHEWVDEVLPKAQTGGDGSASTLTTTTPLKAAARQSHNGQSSAFCRRCNAWRGSLGLEPTPALYIEHMVAVFGEVRRVLRADGTLWVNIGDSYSSGGRDTYGSFQPNTKQATHPAIKSAQRPPAIPGIKPKDLLGIPWMLAFALRDDGWYLRSEITWAKRAPMPESVTDRPTTATEKVFLLAKSERYFYDVEAVKEEGEGFGRSERFRSDRYTNGNSFENSADLGITKGGGSSTFEGKRNMRNWWLLGPEPFPEAHFATFPSEIPRRAILAGCPADGTVLDPFLGAVVPALVADQLQRDCIGIELNPEYAAMTERRLRADNSLFLQMAAD